MPADSLSFAVLIRCKPNLFGNLSILLQFSYNLLFILRYLVVRLKGLLVYAEFFFLQVANMAI